MDFQQDSVIPIALYQYFGLYDTSSKSAVPLKRIVIDALLDDQFAQVNYSQVYFNSSESKLVTEFYFPVPSTACFEKFKAKIGDVTIEGIIKEKVQAKKEYQKNLKAGNTAALAELAEDMPDIMKISIGNILPKTEVSIEFSYLDKIEISMNKLRKFVIYSTITPRYSPNPTSYDKQCLANYPMIKETMAEAYPWKISVSLICSNEIKLLKCSSHPEAEIQQHNSRFASVSLLDGKYYPNKDFVILYSNGDLQKTSFPITPFESGYCSYATFFPELNSLSIDDAAIASMKGGDYEEENKILQAKGEFIFLLDCSGSMSGTRIVKAREALICFLKSLPVDCFYNVISFGSKYKFWSSNSQNYTDKNIKSTILQAQIVDADMGGTEILEPLVKILKAKPISGYPKKVFLLTDGGVSNTKEVINEIKKNNDSTRVFCLGVGNGCSTELVRGSAEAGRGSYEFIQDRERVSNKVISLLKKSVLPFVTEFELKFEDPSLVLTSFPRTSDLRLLVPNELFDVFIVFSQKMSEKKRTSAAIKYYDSITNKIIERTISFELFDQKEDLKIIKYGLFNYIKKTKDLPIDQKQMLFSNDVEAQQLMNNYDQNFIKTSVRYGILTDYTAFICVIREGDDTSNQIPTEKVLVPQIEADDYDSGSLLYATRSVQLSSYKSVPKSASCCGGGGGGSQSYSSNEQESAKIKKEELSPLTQVISNQNINGSWDPNLDTARAIRLNVNKAMLAKPKNITEKGFETIWWTILVLLWLEIKQTGARNSWDLVHKKAKSWLESQGIIYTDYYQVARQFILSSE